MRTQANLFTQTAGQIVIRKFNARGQLVPVLLSDIAEIKLVSKTNQLPAEWQGRGYFKRPSRTG